MKKQKIEVVVNSPEEKVLQDTMAKAIAEIVMEVINKAHKRQKELLYEKIFHNRNKN
ncbi:MAG: hypothetical protein H0Z24_09810 [Thermosipho sp. (in: Bacteria)]|nr:hypothetical protein [Thermosipho sp. (in: thermotogales)]